VIGPDVREHGHIGVDHVGGVIPSEQPDLDDRHVDGRVGERDERRRLGIDHAPGDVVAARHVVHHVEQHLFEDRPQAAGAGAAQQRLVGDGLEASGGELELDVRRVSNNRWYCLTSALRAR
jgi:hypothetical protein